MGFLSLRIDLAMLRPHAMIIHVSVLIRKAVSTFMASTNARTESHATSPHPIPAPLVLLFVLTTLITPTMQICYNYNGKGVPLLLPLVLEKPPIQAGQLDPTRA